jgi:hypothetical protein
MYSVICQVETAWEHGEGPFNAKTSRCLFN